MEVAERLLQAADKASPKARKFRSFFLKTTVNYLIQCLSFYNYKVLILYKPSPWVPVGNPPGIAPLHWLGFPGAAGNIHTLCCGPTRDTACPVGARLSPCAHGAAALLAGCVLPTNPVRSRLSLYIIADNSTVEYSHW